MNRWPVGEPFSPLPKLVSGRVSLDREEKTHAHTHNAAVRGLLESECAGFTAAGQTRRPTACGAANRKQTSLRDMIRSSVAQEFYDTDLPTTNGGLAFPRKQNEHERMVLLCIKTNGPATPGCCASTDFLLYMVLWYKYKNNLIAQSSCFNDQMIHVVLLVHHALRKRIQARNETYGIPQIKNKTRWKQKKAIATSQRKQ